MDSLDIKILATLQEDARRRNADLAHELGVAPSTALERVRRLEAQGRTDFPAYAEARPAICETMHAFCLGLMALETKCPLYVVHVSSRETMGAIRYLRQKGAEIYAETCPHYLTMTADTPLGVLARMEPPLRGRAEGCLESCALRHHARAEGDLRGKARRL